MTRVTLTDDESAMIDRICANPPPITEAAKAAITTPWQSRADLLTELVQLNEALSASDPPSKSVITAWESRRRAIEKQLRAGK